MTTRDWRRIFAEYLGLWVAIDAEDEKTVVAADADPERALARSQDLGREVFLLHVPDRLDDFIGGEIQAA